VKIEVDQGVKIEDGKTKRPGPACAVLSGFTHGLVTVSIPHHPVRDYDTTADTGYQVGVSVVSGGEWQDEIESQ